MSAGKPVPLVIYGWTVFAHPLFLAQIEALAQQVDTFKRKDPKGYKKECQQTTGRHHKASV